MKNEYLPNEKLSTLSTLALKIPFRTPGDLIMPLIIT